MAEIDQSPNRQLLLELDDDTQSAIDCLTLYRKDLEGQEDQHALADAAFMAGLITRFTLDRVKPVS